MYRYHTVSYFNISKALLSELNEKVIPVNVSSPCCHSSYNLYMYHNKPYILIVHLNMLCTFTDVHYNVCTCKRVSFTICRYVEAGDDQHTALAHRGNVLP